MREYVVENEYVKAVRAIAEAEGSQVVVISAKVEAELAELDDEERDLFLEELGIGESGLDKLIKSSYALLDLISFITTGEDETRAWTIKRGTLAPQAAGKIHTDFEKGFIRDETISYDKLMEAGGEGARMAPFRGQGVRSEGRRHLPLPVQRIKKERAFISPASHYAAKVALHRSDEGRFFHILSDDRN